MLGKKKYELLEEIQNDPEFIRMMEQEQNGFNLFELDFGIMKYRAEQDKIKNQQIEELQR